ncbi:mechanosensitive ion channel family protein [Thiothrix nivea]|uniref:MscS Mechanosensitive ion channel n=1 Tax=Thiothrix nivea (strain ATCC 35100 / DSM 5205 / JP2) TaxID=870187 RepID=A0A656H990_THINJ|nr:mechanosensitive ion channel domain-containing protein [Thiothrix nivea]EIJ33381.1 MscS Mechanosensitive ion channel [Thiothrix nivea DSM 5205]
MGGAVFSWVRCILLLVLWAMPAHGEEEAFSTTALDAVAKQLDEAEAGLQRAGEDLGRLDTLTTTALGWEQRAQDCVSQLEQKQQQIQQAVTSLGEARPDEDSEVKRKRQELATQTQQTDKTLSQCRLLSLRAMTLLDEARQARQSILKQQLSAPGRSLLDNLYGVLLEPGRWKTETGALVNTLLTPLVDWHRLLVAFAYGVTGLVVGMFWSVYKRRQYRQQAPGIHHTSPTLAAVWRSLLRVMPYALFAGLAALSLYFSPAGAPPILQFMLALLLFSLSYGVLHSLLRATSKVEGIIPVVEQTTGRKLRLWARLLLFACMIGVVLHSPLLDSATPESAEPSSLVGLIRTVIGTLVGFALARLVWLMSRHFLFMQRTRLRLWVSLGMLVAVASLWLGYRNLAIFLFSGVFGTLFLLLGAWLLLKIPAEIFDGLDEGRAFWQQRLRQSLGLKQGQFVPGLIWLRLTNTLIVGGGLAILLLRLWGMPEQNFTLLLNKLTNGFDIAGFTLEPLRIIGGLLVLALLVSLTHVFKKHFSETWLRRTTLSRGAREAITTISGYSGILLAILLGLAVAGIQFENLAIIAGALSVGIGFGLQNIVNNFVSGLILLFERPIRRGDWIKVGEAEGYVRDISIRSTTIQTFDRSDIIVPNSEIISGQVTNMMLNDNYGRLIIPIGVAYGSDTEQVMGILREVAGSHPLVLKERQDMKILVLFRGFGDNALNFELRCFIREVEAKLTVTSDLNLAIDKAFRQNSIEVPFPQRTVHLVKDGASPATQHAETPAKPPSLG